VLRAAAILDRFGGALIADGVGLGKTYIGLALATLERARGGDAIVLAPAALRGEWQRAAAEVGEPLGFETHTSLARSVPALDGRVSLLVVDEAHAFRNPRTRRYDALARLATGRRVALVTATPVNNTAADLAALIHLFSGTDSFRELGVDDLFAALRSGREDAGLALGAITVCRSRRLIETRFPALRGAFPRRQLLPPVRYDLDATFGGALPRIVDALEDLLTLGAADERGGALLVLGLLRRLESSRRAFLRSLRGHRDFLREFAGVAADGRVLTRRDFRSQLALGDDEDLQTVLWPLLIGPGGRPAARLDHPWRPTVEAVLRLAQAAAALPDRKRVALESLLSGPLRGRKTIVFTEYRDTARDLAGHLRNRFRVLCVAGDGAWAGAERLSRRQALDAFAPASRGAAPDRLLEADVLVATDVASEGMNLQDASAVVNYDLPWNPVRVMQRVGRIDRLYSSHPDVAVAHVVPGHGMGDLAGVLRTLRRKLAAPIAAAAEPDPLSALWWLDAAEPLPQALERESWRRVEPFEARERWRAAAGAAPPRDFPCVAAALAHDDEPPAVGVLLALEWPGGARIPLPFVLEAGRPPRFSSASLGALAERALSGGALVARAGDFATALAAVLPDARGRLISLSAARRGSPPQGPGRRAALLAVAAAARATARDRDSAMLEKLSRASARLTRELPAGLDRALLERCHVCANRRQLAEALERVLEQVPAGAAPPEGTPRLVLVAALAVAGGCPSDPDDGRPRGPARCAEEKRASPSESR